MTREEGEREGLEKAAENLEVCGVCGNPDIEDGNDDDDSYHLNWIQCENVLNGFINGALDVILILMISFVLKSVRNQYR
jgi:hypothetical protein